MTRIHIDSFVSQKAEEVIHLIQEAEQKELQAKNKWDIKARMQDVANHEKHKFDAVQEENYFHRWNELQNAVKRHKGDISADKVLLWMYMLDNKESVKLWRGQSEHDVKEHAIRMLRTAL